MAPRCRGWGSASECRADRQRPAACLFSASECVAAERWQFVGKQTLGPGGCRLAPSLPRTRVARTPPPSAQSLARRDRRDCASPPQMQASASGRGPGLVATPQLLQALETAGGNLLSGIRLYRAPPFLALCAKRSLAGTRAKTGSGDESSLMAPGRAQKIWLLCTSRLCSGPASKQGRRP